MMPWLTDRRNASFAGAMLFVFAVLTAGCGRPPDEAWLRFLGFRASGESSPLSVLNGDLGDGTDLTVDVEFENASLFVGQKSGIGILVNRARIDYRMSGYSPPAAEYPLNLYLSPSVDGTPTTGTLTMFPLAPISLQRWLIDAGVSGPVVELTARVTFYGLADDGASIETEGSLRIALANTGGGGATPAAKPTVYVVKTADASKLGTNGVFTFIRSGSVSAGLTVAFTIDISSTAISGTDYAAISTSVLINAGNGFGTRTVSALPGGTVGRTLKINISDNAAYVNGTPNSATLTIVD